MVTDNPRQHSKVDDCFQHLLPRDFAVFPILKCRPQFSRSPNCSPNFCQVAGFWVLLPRVSQAFNKLVELGEYLLASKTVLGVIFLQVKILLLMYLTALRYNLTGRILRTKSGTM